MTWKSLRSFPLLFVLAVSTTGHAAIPARRAFSQSVMPIDVSGATGGPHLTRTALSVKERSEPVDIVVSLAMRDYAAFAARIMSGAKIPQAEMEEKYLPDRADHDRIAAWLRNQGFMLTLVDSNHTNLFARGTVDQAAAAFQVDFARVATTGGEFTSALSTPSLPADIAGPVLNIDGLQPHIRIRPRIASPSAVLSISGYATPADIAAAYNVPANLTGSGQTIALYGWSALTLSDLTAFWSNVGSPQSVSNLVILAGAGGSTTDNFVAEGTLDVEWAGVMAPGAKLRFYTQANAGTLTSVVACASQVLNDAKADPTITVFTLSYAGAESRYPMATLTSASQSFGQLAAAGITSVASSGDGGSNPRIDGVLGYQASAPLNAQYPASDPFVTGVGGTSLNFDRNFNKISEVAWNDTYLSLPYITGGGYSVAFARPSWQVGGGSPLLASASARCVPDIAACSVWGSGFGYYTVTNGKTTGGGGTSLAAPVFAGVAALINQARATAGLGVIGLLNPWLYPLAGSASFNPITSGNNGAYQAGPIYNLCTGLGTPNTASLISVLAGGGSTLSNMSVRTNLASGQPLTVGFVSKGSKSLLVRAVGPGLNSVFGLTGFYADPKFSLVSGGATIDQNDDWNSSLAATFTQLGAFGLVAGSKDAAVKRTVTGPTTAEVSGAGSGVMLLEVYDADASGSSSRLINASARNQVGTGNDVLVAGFVIAGILPRPLLIRGIGPGLHDVFGVNGVLADPLLEIHQTINGKDTVIASNDNWDPSLTAIFDRVGAYHFTAGSRDAALFVTLPPGIYTAQVSGTNNGTGDGVVEIYEVP